MSEESERIVELELSCRPEAAVSGAMLMQSEYSCFLTFNTSDTATAVVQFEGCRITKFGYPNDEASWKIPRTRGLAYGIYEVLNSSWIRELTELKRHAFPNTPDDTRSRHFLFLFHDSTFECIARDIKVELHDEPYADTFAGISRRLIDE